jgi:hypothetical protein
MMVIMRVFLSILFFFEFVGVTVVVLSDKFDLSGMSVLLLSLLVVSIGVTSLLLAREMSRWLAQRKKERRLGRALAILSMSLEEVLAEAPYQYGHWQGEDGYRIFDTRVKDGYIDFVSSESDAELWIVERYLADKLGQA